jgi:hypothetical protein
MYAFCRKSLGLAFAKCHRSSGSSAALATAIAKRELHASNSPTKRSPLVRQADIDDASTCFISVMASVAEIAMSTL